MRAAALVCGLVLGLLLVSLTPSLAFAQNVSVNNVRRSKATHTQPNTFWVSRTDCESGDVFDFPFTIQNPSSVLSFQVWVGEGTIDCKTYNARSGVAGGQCVQLLADGAPKQLGNVEIASSEIAGALSGVEGCDDASGNYNARDVTIYFLLVRNVGEDIPAEDVAQWTETKVDMLGPPAPTDLVAKIGDGTVIAEYTPRSDNDIRGYRMYCDSGSSSGAGGAGGGGSSEGCSGSLVAGEVPPSDKQCGSVTGVASSISASQELENGTSYQIGVAAYDLLGNAGPLSTTACVTPAPVDDFFSTYRRAGGQAGGGCAVGAGPRSVPGGAAAMGLVALVLAAASVRRHGARRRRARPVAILLGLAAVFTPLAASAQETVSNTDWRRTSRPPPPHPPAQFAFEMRFGPYWPQVDDEFASSPGPYEAVFDNDPQFYFGLEADWMPLRIPHVGMLGLGFGWGFTSASTTARVSGCQTPELGPGEEDPCLSGDETSLSIMPMHLSAVLRADGIMRDTEIPLVPYGKIGLGLATWSASQTSGTSVYEGVEGSDTTWGIHTALGVMMSLNWIEPRAASRLHETGGIAHAYIFGEWMNSMLNGLGSRPQMRVGTSTVVGGLAVDF